MSIALPLDKMTIAEKLEVMEILWRDLSLNESRFDSPAWHGEVLRQWEQQTLEAKQKCSNARH